jgi:hypothetical protein
VVLIGDIACRFWTCRSEFTQRLNEMHMEMVKQFHLAQMDQQRRTDQLLAKLTTLIGEVRDLTADYKSLRLAADH